MIRCTNNNPISYDSRYLFPKESVRIYQCLISIQWYKDPGIGILVQHLDRSLLFPLTSSINKFLLSKRSIYLSFSNKISRLFKNPKESHGIIIFVKFDENDSSPLLITVIVRGSMKIQKLRWREREGSSTKKKARNLKHANNNCRWTVVRYVICP